MLNIATLTGRIVKTPELRKTENGKNVTNITIAVPRPFKNPNGEYETDYIECTLWAGLAETATTYCKQGDLVGIKGRLQTTQLEKENCPKITMIQLIVEKLSFLASKRQEEAE